ncbi:MAG: methyltransferase [Deferribacterales bacterium]
MDRGKFTTDAIIREDIKICQPVDGFRFTTDSLLLAGFVKNKPYKNVLEIGSGSGIISVLLANFFKIKNIYAVELNDIMYQALTKTISLNNLSDKILTFNTDIRDFKPDTTFEMIISNPPYRNPDTGKNSISIVKKQARFTDTLHISDIFKFAKSYLKTGGHLYISYIADRAVDLFQSRDYQLEPKRVKLLYPDIDKPARLIFVEYRKGAGAELLIEPPLFHCINNTINEEFTKYSSLDFWNNLSGGKI